VRPVSWRGQHNLYTMTQCCQSHVRHNLNSANSFKCDNMTKSSVDDQDVSTCCWRVLKANACQFDTRVRAPSGRKTSASDPARYLRVLSIPDQDRCCCVSCHGLWNVPNSTLDCSYPVQYHMLTPDTCAMQSWRRLGVSLLLTLTLCAMQFFVLAVLAVGGGSIDMHCFLVVPVF